MVVGAVEASIATTDAVFQVVLGGKHHVSHFVVVEMCPFNQLPLHGKVTV